MIVMKFGGTSLGDPQRIERVAAIVRDARERGERPVVIVSAHAGVTDALLALATDTRSGRSVDASAIRRRHVEMALGLGLDPDHVAPELAELEAVVRGLRLADDVSPRVRDLVASFGERMAAKAVAGYLTRTGTPACALAAWEAGLVTDDRFGRARPLPRADGDMARALGAFDTAHAPVPVITGFIGRDLRGRITTLGRNGSDYSAAIFGAAIRAREVQIWKDVAGVMTADPRIVPTARLVSSMSYDEAGELAAHGAKVLYPSTIEPLVKHALPIRVLNVLEPDSPGTLIGPKSRISREVVKAIAHAKNVSLIRVSTGACRVHGFVARVARTLSHHGVAADTISTSEVSVSLTVSEGERLGACLRDLDRFADLTMSRGDRAVVCAVGHGLRSKGVARRIFAALAGADVNVELVSQVASNVRLVVSNDTIVASVRALHAEFFDLALCP